MGFLRHETCPDCGGSDCLAIYDDGGRYCFGLCDSDGNGFKPNLDSIPKFVEPKKKKSAPLIKDIDYTQLKERRISESICKKYGYGTASYKMNGEEQFVQVANYYNDAGQVIAQKIRNADKEFQFIGDSEKTLLFGKQLWRNKGGKKVIVTEGEIDCLSIAEAYEGKYPVVSISTGANTAEKCLQANIDWLESFEQVILWFDSDEAGQKALEKCKGIFSPNKLYYIPYDNTYKDASDVLRGEGKQGVIAKTYEAKEFREDNVVRGSEVIFDSMRKDIKAGRPFPYPKLQEKTMGIRDAELIIVTAGSGIGKSTVVTEFGKFFLDTIPETKLGMLYLEESIAKTYDRLIALDHDVPLKDLRLDHSIISEADAYKTHEKYFKSDRVHFYDHFGSVATNRLLEKIRYLNVACGCDTIILDHISIAVSGLDSDEGERKMLDVFMTNLRSFVESTGCTIIAIVHLKRAEKKSFNEGAMISLNDLRGSASLEQLSDGVIAVERDQQGSNPYVAKIRILKWRETGDTGLCDNIIYNPSTGRYSLYLDDSDDFVDEKPKGKRNF